MSRSKRFSAAMSILMSLALAVGLVPLPAYAVSSGGESGAVHSGQSVLMAAIPIEGASAGIKALSASAPASGRYNVVVDWTFDASGALVFSLATDVSGSIPKGSIGSDFWSSAGVTFSKDEVRGIYIGYGITEIGNFAFKGCSNAGSITLPHSLVSIGWNAFEGCESLTDVEVPYGVTSIGNSAFLDCTNLAKVSINGANGATEIGSTAFKGCSSLRDVWLPDGLASIGSYAFAGCESLADVYLPEGLASIGKGAFEGCALASVELPESLTSLGDYAFSMCDSLVTASFWCSNVSFGEDVFAKHAVVNPVALTIRGYEDTTVQAYAIANGYAFEALGPSGRSGRVGDRFWWSLSADGVLTIGGKGDMPEGETFGESRYWKYRSYKYETVKKVVVLPGITGLNDYAFAGLPNLESFELASTVRGLGNYTFANCPKLLHAELPLNDMRYGADSAAGMFEGCKALESVTIPIYMHRIPENMLSECENLKDVYYRVDGYSYSGSWSIPEAGEGNERIQNASVHFLGAFGENLVGELAYASPGNEDMTLTITGSGEFFKHDAPGSAEGYTRLSNDGYACQWWKESRNKVVSIDIQAPLTSIEESAFAGWESLKSVTLPPSIKSIGRAAFEGCAQLTDAPLSQGLEAIGDSSFRSCENLSSVTLPSSLASVGRYAFGGCRSFTSITIPQGLTNIGDGAFAGCGFTDVAIPGTWTRVSDQVFNGCPLTSLQLPASVTAIGAGAFARCEFTDLRIPDTVTSIGREAFAYCPQLQSARLPSNLPSIEEGLFDDCPNLASIVFPTCETRIGGGAFRRCTALAEVAVPGNVKSVGKEAFADCSSLAHVVFGEGVESIGEDAFSECRSLKRADVPRSVASIGQDGLCPVWTDWDNESESTSIRRNGLEIHGCTGSIAEFYSYLYFSPDFSERYSNRNWAWILDQSPDIRDYLGNLWIPFTRIDAGDSACAYGGCGEDALWTLDTNGSLTIFGTGRADAHNYHAFADRYDWLPTWTAYRDSIKRVVVEEGITAIGRSDFADCPNLESVSLPQSLTDIEDWAFLRCSSLANISLPDGLASIGNGAFDGCSLLAGISWPAALETVGSGAFAGCDSFLSVKVPASIGSVPDAMFRYCENLREVVIDEGITAIGTEAFRWCDNLERITIPASVTSIGIEALPGEAAENLTIYFGGTLASWHELMSAGGKRPAFAQHPVVCGQSLDGPLAEGSCGQNVTWSLDGEGVLSIQGTGDMADYDGYYGADTEEGIAPWASYRDLISAIVVGEGVTCIGSGAFHACSMATRVELPSSVTRIGDGAFSRCRSLSSASLPGDVTSVGRRAYYECASLNRLDLPNDLTALGDEAFYGCSSLTSVFVPKGVTSVNRDMFSGMSLTALEVDPANPVFDSRDGCNAVVETATGTLVVGCGGTRIPESVTDIGANAFRSCGSLTEIDIPDSVTSIGDWAFAYSGLQRIAVPDSVTEIGPYAFNGCVNLQDVVLGGGLRSIQYGMFAGCRSCESIVIPQGVESIGPQAFWLCSNLREVTLPGTLFSIGGFAFQSCTSLASVEIPDSVSEISEGAFYDCALGEVVIPKTVSAIGDKAFGYRLDDDWNAYPTDGFAISSFWRTAAYDYAKANGFAFVGIGGEPVRSLDGATIALSKTSYTYDGTAKKPAVTVALGGETVPASGYSVSYSQNKNAGTAGVKVVGKEDYEGELTATFTIAKASSSIKLAAQSKTYTGRAIAYGGKVTKSGSAGKVTYSYFSDAKCMTAVKASAVKNAGAYWVKATLAADANHKAATSTAVKLAVGKASNPMNVVARPAKAAWSKAKARTVSAKAAYNFKGKAAGKVTFARVAKGSSKWLPKVNKAAGSITVKAGAPKGKTQSVKVKVSAQGDGNHKSASKTIIVKVRVG